MTTIPEPTPRRIIAEAMLGASDFPYEVVEGFAEDAVRALCAHGLLAGDPTEAQVERAIEAANEVRKRHRSREIERATGGQDLRECGLICGECGWQLAPALQWQEADVEGHDESVERQALHAALAAAGVAPQEPSVPNWDVLHDELYSLIPVNVQGERAFEISGEMVQTIKAHSTRAVVQALQGSK